MQIGLLNLLPVLLRNWLKGSSIYTSSQTEIGVQVQHAGLLAKYEELLTAEEHSHMMAATTPELRKERLLARVLVRTTLSRYTAILLK